MYKKYVQQNFKHLTNQQIMFILLFIFVKAVEEEEKQEENKQETKRPYFI